jgi:hypothetical protein
MNFILNNVIYRPRCRAYIVWIIFLSSSHWLYPQLDDCTLDIAGQDTGVIIDIFQLNDDQQLSLDKWIGELELARRPIEEELRLLLIEHPQSTEADLHNLAKKYSSLNNKLIELSKEYDRKLLGIFNEKQFEYYVSLCKEASRIPLNPVITVEEEE